LESVHIADLGAWCRISFEDGDANPLAFAHHLYVDGIEVRNLVIPDGVMSIGQYAFTGCTNLVSVTLPPSLTSMGTGAFGGCRGLESVHISDLYAWCGINFANGNANPLSLAHHLFLNGGEVQNLFFPSGLTKVGEYAFVGCGGLLSITLPSSVTSIGGNAFYGCNGLTSVAIPSGVTSIGGNAFYGCSGLTSVTIPSGVTSIGNGAFLGCDNLSSLTISGKNWWPADFISSHSITNLVIAEGSTSVEEAAFAGWDGLISVTIPSGVTSIGIEAFSFCKALTTVEMPDGVTSIGEAAFANCENLVSVNIPDSVVNIEGFAFYRCGSLKSMKIPYGVTSIGFRTFLSCTELASVTIPPSVTTIGGEAFVGCVNLTSVIIPYSVTTLESEVFYECSNLKRVYLPDHFREVALDLGLGRKFYYRLFEGVDIDNNLIWVDAEGAAWLEQEESGQSIARSGIISSCATSSVETVLIGPGTLSFDWRVSSNGDGCCRLYIDDVECRAIMSSSTWMTETVTVSNGEHIARWSFTSSSANASDAAFLTRVSWVPAVVVGDLEIPLDWLTECAATIIAAHGGDKAAAAHATAANGMNKVWECYVAGLSPTNAASVFRTVISFDNGEPVVSWEPKLSPEEETKRTYVIEGKANLTDTWSPTNSASRFFRVRVGMP
jgi:hypothetical protein